MNKTFTHGLFGRINFISNTQLPGNHRDGVKIGEVLEKVQVSRLLFGREVGRIGIFHPPPARGTCWRLPR